MAFTTFADSNLGKKYPAAVKTWENASVPVHPVPRFRARHPQSDLTPPTASNR